jgi:hypothetical protein
MIYSFHGGQKVNKKTAGRQLVTFAIALSNAYEVS